MIIHFSESFVKGQTNNKQFCDLPFMKIKQRELLFDFAKNVKADIALLGKNKPSWLNDSLDQIPNTDNYRAFHFWHYHCGEFPENAPIRRLTYQLKINLDGLTSAAVIHYRKLTEEEIVVVGFSPIHIPFPREDDPDNPLFE